MRVSVVVPVYNEEETVAQVLKSLSEVALDLEVVVVDDASTDRTWEILQELQQREPFAPGHAGGGRFEPERPVAGGLALFSRRELAPQSPRPAGLGAARLDGAGSGPGVVGHRGVGTTGAGHGGAAAAYARRPTP